jgi:proteasome accessory factor A
LRVNSLFGIETEYGLTVENTDTAGLVSASRDVVKAYAGRFAGPWNYRSEDPRNDQRGFHVEKLSHDPVDAQFDRPGERAANPQEDRADRVLPNGARLYNDHGHPEYSTPECSDLRSLVAHDKAGERIVLDCARKYFEQTGKRVEIFKNNTDFHGASYGTHESFLLRRGVDWERVTRNLAPFLATRIIYAGAGKVGTEEKGSDAKYQLSQRADFFSVLQSVDTLHNRPLVNTRDEPHGDARRFRRLHVIAGDANMSEYSTALRVGATNLVANLIESGWDSPAPLRDPVRAIKQISRDSSYKWIVESAEGDTISAVDVQRVYLRGVREMVEREGAESSASAQWILEEWESTLDALARDPFELADRVDWVAKKSLLDDFVESEGLDWTRDQQFLQSLDLQFHNVDPDEGLYYGLAQAGAVQVLVSDEEIETARVQAPPTRACLRGALVEKFAPSIRAISWGAVLFEDGGERFALYLPEDMSACEDVRRSLENASSVRQVADVLPQLQS